MRDAKNYRQYTAFVLLSLVAVGLTAFLNHSSRELFYPYFGDANPLMVVTAAIMTGIVSIAVLMSCSTFRVVKLSTSLRGISLSAFMATVFALVIIGVDLLVRFPVDMNVAVPQALLFYPAIGYVVEILFHLLPLACMLMLAGLFSSNGDKRRIVWCSIFLAAMLEPAYQLRLAPEPVSLIDACVGLHIFLINLFQLWVFRQYDFVTMYLFRLFYYSYWHIGWGMLRLELLF